jgi:hypothetical protein
MDAAVVIYVALSQSGAEPAKKRSATGVGGQGRATLAVNLTKAVEPGVKGVGKVVSEGSGTGNGDRGLCERSTVKAKEALPGDLAAQSAGLGKRQFR